MDPAGRVFRTEAIDDCLVTELPREPRGPFVVGIDWAKYTDFSAVVVLFGSPEDAMLVEAHHFNGLSWGEQVDRVGTILARYPNARILCDATGVGDPVVEQLSRKMPSAGIKGVSFNSKFK